MPEETEHIKWLADALESWDFTFEQDTEIAPLREKIETGQPLSADDVDTLAFHLFQMAHGELLKIE